MDIVRCTDCRSWHLNLTNTEMAALAYIADDWSDATADDEELVGAMGGPAGRRLWAHAQRICSAIIEPVIRSAIIEPEDQKGRVQ